MSLKPPCPSMSAERHIAKGKQSRKITKNMGISHETSYRTQICFLMYANLLTPLNLELLFIVVAMAVMDCPACSNTCFCCSPCLLHPGVTADGSLLLLLTHLVTSKASVSAVHKRPLSRPNSDFTVVISIYPFLP